MCDILPDVETKTYYMVASGGGGVRAWTSTNLVDWQGPKTIFRTPPDIWGDIRTAGIWAPEMHEYKGKYYLFLTFDSRHLLGSNGTTGVRASRAARRFCGAIRRPGHTRPSPIMPPRRRT